MTLQERTVLSSGQPLASLWQVFKSDWVIVLGGAFLSFVLASVFISGWPSGLLPDLSAPYRYAGDSLFHAWMAQRVSEGWLFENIRSGYPFGSNFLDYPGSDFGNHLLIKLLAIVSGSSFKATNLFLLLSFPVGFSATFVVVRAFGLFRSFAFVAAMLFTFLPFHLLRMDHLFYTWYFVVPFFFYLSYSIFQSSTDADSQTLKGFSYPKAVAVVLGLLVLSSFGVYYALFGVMLVALGGVLGWCRARRVSVIIRTLCVLSILMGGVLLNVAPNMLAKNQAGPNLEVAQRSPMEAEVYGFKLMQLILPRADHRISWVGKFTSLYNSTFPLINENATSTLGAVGALGLLLAFCVLLLSLTGHSVDPKLGFLVALVFVLFMLGTIGGLGALFSSFVSSSIRGWNRISVFVGFGALLIFFIVLQTLMTRYSSRLAVYSTAILTLLLVVGLYDQTAPACRACNASAKAAFENDRAFVTSIEAALPAQAAVYQLPYIAFPEMPPVHRLNNYQLGAGVLHSKTLRWSFGGMKGREGDLFYRALAQETPEKQLEVIKNLGFNGIYIDRRGYEDNAQSVVQQFTALLGSGPSISSVDGNLVFFNLNRPKPADLSGLSFAQIMKKSGYYADKLGARYPGSLKDGIDFTRDGWPNTVKGAEGLSGKESWGRWSDARLSNTVRIEFTAPLPQTFTLVLVARAFAPNVNKPIKVTIGNREYEVLLGAEPSEVRLSVDLQGDDADSIVFSPPTPVSPQQLGVGNDSRKLGIGFVSLRLE
ncbi:DUF7024 domain-containing protein [Pseudomonas canadensis]|uniref:DUF7024 domain-containing protein n=1 Tax=Pseudomonas canadensis TaxID=915099 RepID=UPI0021823E4B|nr:sugar translocase [Pseudomonas canadensis]